MLKKAVAMFLIFASMAIWVGCVSTTSRYLYAAIPNTSQIVAYREDPNSGVLTALTVSPITAGASVQSVAVHPSKKFLYATNSGLESDISLFTIASSGALTEVTPRTTAGTTPTLMVMDAAGQFLYVANVGSRDISSYSIDPTSGALTPVSGSPFPIATSALNMKLSPSGNVLYVTGSGTPGFVEVWPVSAGALNAQGVTITSVGTNPNGLAINPAGTFLYVANSAPDNTISEFGINADGSLAPLGVVGGSTLTGPTALLVDNSGTYLFAANTGSSNIAGFTIGSDGSLSLLATNSTVATNSQPNVMVSDPTGKYIFVGNQSSPAIQSFSLSTGSGTLTSIASYSVGNTPTSIALTP